MVIVSLWAECYVQKTLVSFESGYTMGEVYYVYQNTQIFIRKEMRAWYFIIFSFVLFISLYITYAFLYVFWDNYLVIGYFSIGI